MQMVNPNGEKVQTLAFRRARYGNTYLLCRVIDLQLMQDEGFGVIHWSYLPEGCILQDGLSAGRS